MHLLKMKGLLEVFRVQRHSHFPVSKGIPHSVSTIMGRGVSFANAYKNSSLAYRIGLVDMVVQVVELNIVRGPEGQVLSWRR